LQGYISDALGDSWFDSVSGDAELYDRSTGCGISFKDGVLRFGRINPTNPEEGVNLDVLIEDVASAKESLAQMNSDEVISPIEKTYLRERLSDIRAEYEELLAEAERYLVAEYMRVANGVLRKAGGKARRVFKKSEEWDAYVNAYILAVAALEKYTAPSPEYIDIEPDFANIGAYYEARATIAKSLREAAAVSTDLDYLRENFQNSTTEVDGQSGVVLSGFVGVKDEGNAKVVAGMAGCALPDTTDPKHGKLMFFAGADGIENAGSATTRIYEDGHVEMGTGVFSGYTRVPFKRLSEEGTDYDRATNTHTVNRNLNLITQQVNWDSYIITIKLPTSSDYIGSVINIYDCPVRTRSSSNVIIATDDEESGILCSLGYSEEMLTYFPIQRIECFGGLIQFIAVPSIYSSDKCWWMVSHHSMTCFSLPFSI
jgi:hypothetical protein